MAVGMGTVFVFLTLLVLATQAMSRAVSLIGGGEAEPASTEEIAAITAALELHRRKTRVAKES